MSIATTKKIERKNNLNSDKIRSDLFGTVYSPTFHHVTYVYRAIENTLSHLILWIYMISCLKTVSLLCIIIPDQLPSGYLT